MKKKLLLSFLLLMSIQLSSQVSIGNIESRSNKYVPYAENHDVNDFKLLKKTTCYFVVPSGMDFEKFRSLLADIWTFNELKFITTDEFFENQKKYVGLGKSVIRYCSGSIIYDEYGYGTYRDFDLVENGLLTSKFALYFCKKEEASKDGKVKRSMINFSEIFFTQNIKLRHKVIASGPGHKSSVFTAYAGKIDKKNKEEELGLYNFNLGYIKNYFQQLNDKLIKGENLIVKNDVINKSELKKLKTKTLYVPDWMLRKINGTKGFLKEVLSPKELMKKYPYKYLVVSNEEINDKILNKEEFYYLMHTQIYHMKLVSVINSLTGEIVYLNMNSMVFNVKDSDISKLVKEIK